MYKMIKAVGNDGKNKLSSIAAIHSLYGYFYEKPVIGEHIYFVYDDRSEKMMCSSIITNVQYVENQIRIETINSEYWFEKITKLEEE